MTIREKKRRFNAILFRWHKNHYRDMPWRRTHDPYRILVSEIMLQQTQVARVRTKYAPFLKQFPHVQALAKASLGDVLRAWSGLGYNRRARYLHDCAKQVVREYGGKFPDELETLQKLPGVGLSTAGALLAFAFGKDEPMIDTNIRRILARTFFGTRLVQGRKKIQGLALKKLPLRPGLEFFSDPMPRDKELYLFARSLISKGKGRAWNYAMLDLGATLCAARNHSGDCPLLKLHGDAGDFRYKKPQKQFPGSSRFYRGRILHRLIIAGSTTHKELAEQLDIDKKLLKKLVCDLKREHLITEFCGKIFLPSETEEHTKQKQTAFRKI